MLMLRVMGALLAGIGTAIYGFEVSKKLMRGCKARDAMIKLLCEIERGVAQGYSLSEIFKYSSGADCDAFLPSKFKKIICEKSEKPLLEALKTYSEFEFLTLEERDELITFASHLGTYASIEDELAKCRRVTEFLERKKIENDARDKQKSVLAAKLGILVGGLILIIFGI